MARLLATGRLSAGTRALINRYNLRIAVGSYTGNGTGQFITTTFRPDLVIVQGTATTSHHSTLAMPPGDSLSLGTTTAASQTSILTHAPTGFHVGTNSAVNTNGSTYYYIVVSGNDAQNYFRTFAYRGTAADNRQLTNAGIFMQPDIMWVRGGTVDTNARISAQVGDDTFHFAAVNNITNAIQAFLSSGAELGTAATVNGSGVLFYGTAFKNYPGVIASGQYTGNGADDRVITTGINMADLIIVKAATGNTSAPMKHSSMATDTSHLMTSGASSTIRIKNPTSVGFTVGTSTNVNGNGTVYNWFSIKAGNFYLPVTRNLI